MSKAILNNDVLDIIYDSICGYPLEEAYKILEDHRRGMYISVEWIEKYIDHRLAKHGDTWSFINCMMNDWEEENESIRV